MKAVRFGPTPGNWCQKLLHGLTRQTRWTVFNAEKAEAAVLGILSVVQYPR